MLLQVKRRPILLVGTLLIVAVVLVVGYILFTLLKPKPQVINCGTLYLQNGTHKVYKAFDSENRRLGTAQSIGNCFGNAYQQCQVARLIIVQYRAVIGTTSMFTIGQVDGKCIMLDSAQSYNINTGGSRTPFSNDTCANLTYNGNTLHFVNCGKNGDVLVSF